MYSILTILILNLCPDTLIVDNTTRPWSERDDQMLERAKYVCATRYAPNVCLKELRRFDDYRYHAICGQGGHHE